MNGFSSNFNAADAQPMPMQNTSFSAIPPFPAAPADSNPAPSQQPSATALTSVDASPSSKPSTTPKRKQAQKSGPRSVEEESRITAEEDKRRRNTAASARFRVKKKLREQTLEKTVKDTTSRNTALEARVSQLELENQWLKNLITEKNDGNSGERKSENDIAEMFKKFLASQKPEGERSLESKNGVGTSA